MNIPSEEDKIRANTYRVIAGLFLKEPDGEFLKAVKEDFEMDFKETPEEIAIDFARIFVGPGKHLPPYESLYNFPTGEQSGLWGKTTDAVHTFYESSGLMLDEEINLIPDHIAVELLFMSYLVEGGRLELQKRFMDEHIMKWIPEYCNEVSSFANTVFYKEIAEITRDFLLSEYEELHGKGL